MPPCRIAPRSNLCQIARHLPHNLTKRRTCILSLAVNVVATVKNPSNLLPSTRLGSPIKKINVIGLRIQFTRNYLFECMIVKEVIRFRKWKLWQPHTIPCNNCSTDGLKFPRNSQRIFYSQCKCKRGWSGCPQVNWVVCLSTIQIHNMVFHKKN